MTDTELMRQKALEAMNRYPVGASYYTGGTVPITFRMPPEVKEAFFSTARDLELNPSGLLRQMVTDWLKSIDEVQT